MTTYSSPFGAVAPGGLGGLRGSTHRSEDAAVHPGGAGGPTPHAPAGIVSHHLGILASPAGRITATTTIMPPGGGPGSGMEGFFGLPAALWLLRQRVRERLKEVLDTMFGKIGDLKFETDPNVARVKFGRYNIKWNYIEAHEEKLITALVMLGFSGESGVDAAPSKMMFHNNIGRLLNQLADCDIMPDEFAEGVIRAARAQVNLRAEERDGRGVGPQENEAEAEKEMAVVEEVKEQLDSFTGKSK
jgi:hypothetical protein